jgi:tetratricopeptide (TPR) repeat protein
MKQALLVALIFLGPAAGRSQVRAGSPELQLYEQIAAEMNVDTKLELIRSFETKFPSSKIMARVCLIAVDLYRTKQDRGKTNEYAEKALNFDPDNVTAMMLLARNYAIEAKNLDRAMALAQKALERTEQLRKEPPPTGSSAAQWQDYLSSNSASAKQILDYVSSIKARSEGLKSSPSNAITTNTGADNQKQ